MKLHHQAAFCVVVLPLTFAQMYVITEHRDHFYAFQFMSFQDTIFEASICMGHSNPSTIQHSYLYHPGDLHFYLSLQKQQCAEVGFHHSSDKSIEVFFTLLLLE